MARQANSQAAIQQADLLSRWAFNQMLIGVATRKYARSVRLRDGDLAEQARRHDEVLGIARFVALSAGKDSRNYKCFEFGVRGMTA